MGDILFVILMCAAFFTSVGFLTFNWFRRKTIDHRTCLWAIGLGIGLIIAAVGVNVAFTTSTSELVELWLLPAIVGLLIIGIGGRLKPVFDSIWA